MNDISVSYKVYVQLYDENRKPLNQYLYMDKAVYDEIIKKLKLVNEISP